MISANADDGWWWYRRVEKRVKTQHNYGYQRKAVSPLQKGIGPSCRRTTAVAVPSCTCGGGASVRRVAWRALKVGGNAPMVIVHGAWCTVLATGKPQRWDVHVHLSVCLSGLLYSWKREQTNEHIFSWACNRHCQTAQGQQQQQQCIPDVRLNKY